MKTSVLYLARPLSYLFENIENKLKTLKVSKQTENIENKCENVKNNCENNRQKKYCKHF